MTDFNVGERVKQLRQEKKMSVRELARRSGVSATQISEIERNLTSPTVPTLMKIISALGTNTSIFFQDEKERTVSVVRKNERQRIIDRKNNVYIESITTGISNSNLKAIIAYPPPGTINIPEGYQHRGEELIYVIKGSIKITVGCNSYILHEGDSIHFRGELRHTIQNISNSEAELLSVISPPNY